MSDEKRLERLEDKVDVIKEDVTELKVELRLHMEKVDEHITGDKKIINEITPLLSSLPALIDMAQDHQFKKKMMEEKEEEAKHSKILTEAKNAKWKNVAIKVGIVTTIISTVAGIYYKLYL